MSTSPSFAAMISSGLPPSAYMMTIKPGCRGDPRMNRAVTAKLNDPSLSLFEALIIGGFTYPHNVDAATMDNDRVTLGQRKNQLNRRLRQARQNMQNKANKADKPEEIESAKKPTASQGPDSPLAVAGSYLRQRTGKGGPNTTPTKRSSPDAQEMEEPPRQAKKQCREVATSLATSIPPSAAPLPLSFTNPAQGSGDANSLFNALTRTMVNTNELSWATPLNIDNTAVPRQPVDEGVWRAIKNNFGGDGTTEDMMTHQVSLAINDHVFGGPQNVAANNSMRSVSANNFQSPTLDNSHEPTPLREGMVGLSSQVNNRKEELGLRIFQQNLQGLYQKSMLAAGYTPQEASHSSQAYQNFAFQAWKGECERLQVLLKDHVVSDPRQPSTPDGGSFLHR